MNEQLILGSLALKDIQEAEFGRELLKEIIQTDSRLRNMLPKSNVSLDNICKKLKNHDEWDELIALEKENKTLSVQAYINYKLATEIDSSETTIPTFLSPEEKKYFTVLEKVFSLLEGYAMSGDALVLAQASKSVREKTMALVH